MRLGIVTALFEKRSLSRSFALSLLLLTVAHAEDYLLPATPPAVVVDLPALVEADRVQAKSFPASGPGLIVTRLAEEGVAVRAGEPLVEFDPTIAEDTIASQWAERLTAEVQLERERLSLARERQDLEQERIAARAERASVIAQLAALGRDTASRLSELHAAVDQAELAIGSASRAAKRTQAKSAIGLISEEQARSADHAARRAELERTRTAAEWQVERDRDRSLDRARLEAQLRAVDLRLGVEASVTAAATSTSAAIAIDESVETGISGFTARIRQLDSWRESRLGWASEALRSADDGFRTALRTARDGTPLDALELIPAGSLTPALRVRFRPADTKDEPGWAIDRGEPLTGAAPFGWSEDAQLTPLHALDGDAASAKSRGASTPPRGGRGRNRAPNLSGMSVGGSVSAALLAHAGSWTARVADGDYDLHLCLGDRSDWDGILVRCDAVTSTSSGDLIACRQRIEAGKPETIVQRIQVRGGGFTLRFGDGRKAVRATGPGIMLLGRRVRVGMKTDTGSSPVALLVEPQALRLNARAPIDVGLLLAKDRGNPTVRAEALLPGRAPLSVTVANVGSKPVGRRTGPFGWEDAGEGNDQDLVFREVLAALSPGDALSLRSRATATLRLTLTPAPGTVAVPAHLVGRRGDERWIRAGRTPQTVIARTAGIWALVVTDLAPGVRIREPGEPPTAAAAAALDEARNPGFSGEVVSGVAVKVLAREVWGQVQEQVADGTDVAMGDQVMLLYNPWLERQKDSIDRERRESARRLNEALDNRRKKLEESAARRREAAESEMRERATAIARSYPAEDLPVRRAAEDLARAEAARAEDLRRRTAAMTTAAPVELARTAAAVGAAQARAERSALERSSAARGATLPELLEARSGWREALGLLDAREAQGAVDQAQASAEVSRALLSSQWNWSSRWADDFERERRIKAPVAGRLYWLTGWNGQVNAMTKFARDMWVWQGIAMAEIVDLSDLAFSAEVPEAFYTRLRSGDQAVVRLTGNADLRLPCTVTAKGEVLTPPKDLKNAGTQVVADTRVFTVRLRLPIPAEMTGKVQPGMRGAVEFPGLAEESER